MKILLKKKKELDKKDRKT